MENQKTLSEVLTRHLRISERRKKLEEKHYASNAVFFVDQSEETEAEKTIDQWAKENNVNLFVITPDGFEITPNAKRITYEFSSAKENDDVIAPAAEQIDILDKPNTVLVFKNIHQMQDKRYRRYLLELVNGHRDGLVADDREPTGYKILNGLMFAIATHNKALDLELFRTDAKDSFTQYDYNEFEKENNKMAKATIDNKIFDFVFGCALVDAVQMQAYPYEHKPKTHEYPQAVESIKKLVHKVIAGKYADQKNDQGRFDADFYNTALEIRKEIPNFTFGNSQKLLNMTFKHMYTIAYLNDEMKHNFAVCHCPVDRIMLDEVWKLIQKVDNKKELLANYFKAGDFKSSWSKEDFASLEKYENSRYMIFQTAVRQISETMDCSPIEFDYLIWQ